MKLVRVNWFDIVSDSAWQPLDKADTLQPHLCQSVGYVVHETEQVLTLAATYSDADDSKETNSRVCIPKGCIESVVELTTKE